MSSEFLFESLDALADRYVDLSEDLRALADTQEPLSLSYTTASSLTLLCHDPDPGSSGSQSRTIRSKSQELRRSNDELPDLLKQAATYLDETKGYLARFIVAPFDERWPEPRPDDDQAESQDTVGVEECRRRFVDIEEFIDELKRSLKDLGDGSGPTKNFELRSLRQSVDGLFAYPVLTSAVDSAPFQQSLPATSGNSVSLERTVTGAIREVLGRSMRSSDSKSFLVALNQSFIATEIEGRVEYKWNPRSFAGQADLSGGITGGQASLSLRAKVATDNAIPLLEGLTSLREDTDFDLVDASRGIIRSYLEDLVREFGVEGGPRIAKIDGIFKLLFEQAFEVDKFEPAGQRETVAGHIKLLAHELGLANGRVNNLAEEMNFTNFLAFEDHIKSIRSSWETFKNGFLGKDLGTRFVLLSRALSVIAESVQETYSAMDSVFFGPAERQVASFDDATGRPMTVSDLLSWVEDFASTEAPRLVQDGGRRGTQTLIPTANTLQDLIGRLLRRTAVDRHLPDGIRQRRVQFPLSEIRGYLRQVVDLASSVYEAGSIA